MYRCHLVHRFLHIIFAKCMLAGPGSLQYQLGATGLGYRQQGDLSGSAAGGVASGE